MKWLEFSVYDDKCKHYQDYYEGCPLCHEEKLQEEIDELTTRLNLLEEFCEKVQVHLPTMAKADLHHYFNTFGRLNQEKE